ncbi:MAG TPA: hypothetical protein VL860_11630, partial [Planctomycetota bacterium]|nr:hypothetical protein [Planctomycetota bacterium]
SSPDAARKWEFSMTGGKITLIVFNAIFAAVLIGLLWVCSAKSLEFEQKRAAIKANQAILKGQVDVYKLLRDDIVGVAGTAGEPKSLNGTVVFVYDANDRQPVIGTENNSVILPPEDPFIGQDGTIKMPQWKKDEKGYSTVEIVRHQTLLHAQASIEKQRAGAEQKDNAKDEHSKWMFAEVEAKKKLDDFKAAVEQVAPAWAVLKVTNDQAATAMRTLMTDWQESQDRYLSSEANLRNEIYRKKTSLVRMKIDHQKQQATWSRQENQMSDEIETTSDLAVWKAMRETRSNELQADGYVLDSSINDFQMITIDIGRRNGVREGLIFTVYNTYSGQHEVKGEIQVTEVRETTSICKLLHRPKQMFISDRTQYRTDDDRVNFDPLGSRKVAGSAEMRPEPMRPHSPASERQDVLDQLIPPKNREFNANPQATGALRPEYDTPSTNPIQHGDMVASAEFQPVISQREASTRFYSEMSELRDVSLERLNFAMMPDFSDNEVQFLKRNVKSNGCVTHDSVQPRTNFLIVREPLSEYVATNADRLRFLLETNDKSSRGLAADSKVAILAAKRGEFLNAAQQYNTRIMTMDEATTFFQQRRRKADLLSGKLELAGRSMFYVAGMSATRSRKQTEAFIQENNGLVSEELSDEVDWLVAGAGSEKEIDQAKKLGVRILREKDLEQFFAHTATVTGGN